MPERDLGHRLRHRGPLQLCGLMREPRAAGKEGRPLGPAGLGAQPSPDVLRLKSSGLHKYNSHHISSVKGKQSSITLLRTNLVFFL